jgi:GH25 family lysozyme M1 (1,4-beta-N-acetylmuramidase)
MVNIADMPRGIDVSKHQARVDWAKVAAAGFKFGFARAIDDKTGTTADPQLKNNLAGMQAAGLFRGAYHFFRPNRNVTAAANLFVSLLGRLAPGDLNPVIDVESADGANAAKMTDGVARWIDIVEAGVGRQVIIYTFAAFWKSQMGNTARFNNHPLWIAHFTNAAQPNIPSVWSTFTFWQHTEKGKAPGVAGNVDLDRFNGSMNGLRAFAGLQPIPAPPVSDMLAAAPVADLSSKPMLVAGATKGAKKAGKPKQTTAKKAGAKRTAAKKSGAKKTTAKKATGAKAGAKKAGAKGVATKSAARKAPSKSGSKKSR